MKFKTTLKMNKLILTFAILLVAQASLSATLPEAIDAVETASAPMIPTAGAKADLITLRDQIKASYFYEQYYESRWKFDLTKLVDHKLLEVDRLSVDGKISLNDFRALVSETVSKYRDAHEWISPKGNSKLSLNIGLTFGESERQYLMYKGNPEIYSQLGVSDLAAFEAGRYLLTAFNGVPMNQVEKALMPVLPYSNSLTRHSYAGILLSSSKGLLYLSTLMKRGTFPMSDEGIRLTLFSIVTHETKVVTVHPQQMADYGTDDLIGKVEGRSDKIVPLSETPEAYAKAYGWKFEEIKPGVFVFTSPSWAGDLIHSDRTIPSRRALYQYVVNCMAQVQATPNAELILDVRGNRGGDVILWQPVIQKLMSQKANVTGVIQLNDEATKVYTQYRNLTTDESLGAKDHRDYLNFSYAASDTDLNPEVRAAVDSARAHLKSAGVLREDRISQDGRFSKLLYITTEKKQAGDFTGHVSVLADRYGFSANDTFVAALRAVVPAERLTVYGERPEGGSGTAGHIALVNSKLSVPSGTFGSYNVDGKMIDSDFEKPDVELKLPLSQFFNRAQWYLERVLQDISSVCDARASTVRDARAIERAKEKRDIQCKGSF